MHLRQLTVDGMHGFLNINLALNEDMTVIVGPNGSGKTSALALISAMLRLDVATIRSTAFIQATLTVHDEILGEVSVIATNQDTQQTLVLRRGDVDTDLVPPTRSIAVSSKWLAYARSQDSLFDDAQVGLLSTTNTGRHIVFSPQDPRLHALQQATEFVERAKLTFVQLDRTIVAVDAEGNQALELRNPLGRVKPKSALKDPIEEVIRVTKDRYLQYKTTVEQIKDKAYLESLRLHFKPIDPSLQDKKMEKRAFNLKLKTLRERVDKSSITSDQPELKAFASTFFDQFQGLIDASIQKGAQRRTGRRTLDDEQLEAILNLKQLQIEDLLTIFEKEFTSTQEAYGPIRHYLSLADKFFVESGKKLTFDNSYELKFQVKTPDVSDQTLRSLKELSSGERQILIILTYLAFVSGESSIFVIDEPELSLHISWQGYLIDALKELRPSKCQIIVATHSPEIAGRALEYCTSLHGSLTDNQQD